MLCHFLKGMARKEIILEIQCDIPCWGAKTKTNKLRLNIWVSPSGLQDFSELWGLLQKKRGIGVSDFQEFNTPKGAKGVKTQHKLIFTYLPLFSTLFCSSTQQRSCMTLGKNTTIHSLSLDYMSPLLSIYYRMSITVNQTQGRRCEVKVETRERYNKVPVTQLFPFQKNVLTVMCYIIFFIQMSDFFHYVWV